MSQERLLRGYTVVLTVQGQNLHNFFLSVDFFSISDHVFCYNTSDKNYFDYTLSSFRRQKRKKGEKKGQTKI